MVLKMPSAGGQVATETLAPASARALAIAKPKPASAATPATSACFPVRSIVSMRTCRANPRRDQLAAHWRAPRRPAAEPREAGPRPHARRGDKVAAVKD